MSRTPVISIPLLGSFLKKIQRTVGGFQVFGKKNQNQRNRSSGLEVQTGQFFDICIFFYWVRSKDTVTKIIFSRSELGAGLWIFFASNGVSWSTIKTETCYSNPPDQVPAQHWVFFLSFSPFASSNVVIYNRARIYSCYMIFIIRLKPACMQSEVLVTVVMHER